MGKKHKKQEEVGAPALYKLQVILIDGPVTQKFVSLNPEVSRTIAIRGDQTLEDLHWAIYEAFDREEEHMYEFQFGKKPHDRKAKRYVIPEALEQTDVGFFSSFLDGAGLGDDTDEGESDEDASRTIIGSLPLKPRSTFWYWFDFGDEWWHKIKVVSIEKDYPKGRYPRVVERVGQSPPQYPDGNEDDADDYE